MWFRVLRVPPGYVNIFYRVFDVYIIKTQPLKQNGAGQDKARFVDGSGIILYRRGMKYLQSATITAEVFFLSGRSLAIHYFSVGMRLARLVALIGIRCSAWGKQRRAQYLRRADSSRLSGV